MEDEQKNVEATYFLKASYFVLPMPALHSFVVPYPRESDLETKTRNIYIFCGTPSNEMVIILFMRKQTIV